MRATVFLGCFMFFVFIVAQLSYGDDLSSKQDLTLSRAGVEAIIEWAVGQNLITKDAGQDLSLKYNELPEKTKDALEKVSDAQIKERFLNYAESKRTFLGSTAQPLDKVDDFNWQYLLYDVGWALFTVVSSDAVSVNNIASGPTVMVSDGFDIFFKPEKEEKIVVPMLNNSFIVRATGATGDTVWYVEDVGPSKSVYFPLSHSEGVVLLINSDPTGADIYFNNKKYYRKTNTTCVRDPGEYTVTIRKGNYKSWTKDYILKKGEQYSINAKLEKNK